MFIITSKTRAKARRTPVDRQKAHADNVAVMRDVGVHNVIPLKGQSVAEAYDKAVKAKGSCSDVMARRKELDTKKKVQGKKRSFKENERRYHDGQEQRAKAEHKARSIVL